MSRLSSPLQIDHLQHTFTELNPAFDVDMVDWRATLDPALTMGENVDVFREAYPQFSWDKSETIGPGQYEQMVIAGLQEEAEPYGYDLVRSRRLSALEKISGRVDKLKSSLEKCRGLKPKRAPRKKVTCREADKVEVVFRRCPRPG